MEQREYILFWLPLDTSKMMHTKITSDGVCKPWGTSLHYLAKKKAKSGLSGLCELNLAIPLAQHHTKNSTLFYSIIQQ
jgi:hypothetical protein